MADFMVTKEWPLLGTAILFLLVAFFALYEIRRQKLLDSNPFVFNAVLSLLNHVTSRVEASLSAGREMRRWFHTYILFAVTGMSFIQSHICLFI
jgi:hypothetical protein